MAALSAALIAELDEAVDGRSPERRAEILRQVTSLFLCDAHRLSESQIAVFDDVLIRLIEQADAPTLVPLSVDLCQACSAPRRALRQLAFHQDASVAEPVLRRSSRLSEQDLIEIASTSGQQHLLAICGRQTIHESLSDPLVQRGEQAVHMALVQNLGARFSEAGCAALVEKARRDCKLAEKLVRRSDVPPALRGELGAKLDDARMRHLQSVPPAMREKIHSAIATTAKQIEDRAPESADYAKAQAKIAEISRTGRLNDSTVNRFAVSREYENVVAALSFLAEVPIEVIAPLTKSAEPDGLIVACKAARLNWSTTSMIVLNRPGCAAVAKQELEAGKAVFDALSLSVAQRTIRF
jgi:uncharacterized protein (DUF2336 family)